MKKTLSLLLVLCMLASLCTVPVFAEDETLDLPVIEEVTEEEMEEEVEIFGDEVELFESTVELKTFEPAEGDGVTYFTEPELEGAKISFTGNSEGEIANIVNGVYTTGTWGDTSVHKFYYYADGKAEGFLGMPASNTKRTTITIDFGEAKTFSGIRLYDSVRSRSYAACNVRDVKAINMQVSNDNMFKWHALETAARSTDVTTESGDFVFKTGGAAVNVTARYLRFTVTQISSYGEFELEEIVMLDPVAENATKVMDTDIIVNVDMPAALTAAEKEGVTMLSAATAKVVFKGLGKDGEATAEKPATVDGLRSGYDAWSLNTSAPTDRYFTIELTNPAAFTGVRAWMHIRNASWANGYFSGDKSQNGKVQRIPETAKAMISDDGINWEPVEIEISRNDTYWYLDMPFAFDGAAKNFTAKYIRVYPTKIINGWGEWEVGEVALLNTNAELDTYESVKEISDEVEGRYDYYRAGKFFSYKSGGGIPIEYNGKTYSTGDWNPVDRLFDGNLSGTSYYHTAANISVNNDKQAPYVPIPKEIRTITITFNEATQIGGFRVYPRTDNTGGNPYRVNVYASNDGENYTLVRNTAKVFASTDKAPKKVMLEKGLPAYKYYKFEVYSTAGSGSSTAHACYCELQVLKPSTFGLDLTEGDFIPYPAGAVKAYTVDKDGKATLFRTAEDSFVAIDGVIINQALLDQAVAAGESQYAFQLSHDFKIGGCIPESSADKSKYTAESAYIVYDLGSVQTFSGVRIYGRTGQGKQAFKNGVISISDDGTNWLDADAINTSAPFINTMPLTFLGESFDVKAKYVKIHCLATNSGHWSFEEIRLLNPVDAETAKTKDEIVEALESKVTAVIELIAAIETAEDKAAAVTLAREAYEALPESLKGDVTNLDVLEAAEEAIYAEGASEINAKIAAIKPWEVELSDADAIKALRVEFEALPEEVKPFVVGLDELEKALSNLTQKIDLTQTERTVESGKYGSQLGYTPVDYTLYVSDDEVEVTEVIYKGEAVDNTYDKWTFVNNGDGTLTLTLAGNYWKDPAKKGWLYSSSMHESIKKGEGNYWVFAQDYPVYDVKKGDTLNPDKFVGTFVRDVSLDNLGDHMITVVLSDGTEKEINLRSYVSWSNLNADPKSASEDAIQPSTSWKIASTNTSIEGRAFDGNLTNGTNSTTFVAAYNDKDGNKVNAGQHILFGVGHTVWLDLGTATKIGGIRLYNNNNKDVLNDVELYGSNDLETWTLIGSVKDNNTKSITVVTFDNDAYRYIEVKNTKYNNGSPTYAWYSEIEVLKAETRVAGNNVVTFDPSEEIEAEFAIALVGEETLTGVTDAEDEAIEYTYEDGVITIDRDYLLTLANGTIEFKATFSNGAVVTLTVDKKDSSKTSYLLADKSTGRASEALELESLSGKAVKSVSVNGANIEYSVNGNNTIITIGRRAFRNSYELFATMDVVTNGVVEVLVTYEDESTKTFYVTITSEWLTIGEPTATFKADEVVPATGAWKIRTSAASSVSDAGVGAFYLPAQNSANHQHWHTSYTGAGNKADQDLDHFIDVDFGANAPSYNGVRIMERVGGSFYKKVTVYGKNADGEDWTLLGTVEPTTAKNPVEIKFNDTVNYRYVRMRFDGNSTHVTADTIHFTKAVASLASDKTVTVDTKTAETATFKFNLVATDPGAIEVKVDDAVISADNYTWAEGVLVLSAEYTATLAEGNHTVVATIDRFPITLTIKKADKYTVSYVLAGGNANPRGTENLVLGIPVGKTVSGITYKGAEVSYTTTENNITISRSAFRNLDDMFDMTSLKLDVTFEGDEEATPYTVNLSKVAFTVSGADAANFAEDEIVAVDGWKVMVSSARDANGAPSRMFIKPAGVDNAWHTGYEEKNGWAIADSAFPRNYLEVDFGEEALKFAGFRYYARTEANQTSGVWQGIIVYGRNSADEDWKEIKSQDFAWPNWKNVRETTVYFGEDVSYKQLRFVIDCDGHATGRGFAFLKPGSRPEAPEESEGKVNVQVTPSTGGNVTVNNVPTQGDNYVEANKEVTFEATPDATGEGVGFMYWVEANTGKILGKDTSLTVKATSGKDIKAVFADPASFEVFVSFFGRNANSVIAHSYVKKGEVPKIPSNDKLYTTGYEFKYWTNAAGEEVDMTETVDVNTEFYAYYEAKTTKQSKITVEGGKVRLNNNGDTASTEATYAYDTPVKVIANEAEEGMKFSHWEIAGKIVSYEKTYRFYAPDADITVKAVFVSNDADVEEAVSITMTKTLDSINGVAVASFLTTRYVPTGVEVLETGVIYVKDASYGALTIADIGKTSANGKAVKVATCDKTTSGQYKLTASYAEFGIKAVGFITYVEDGAVKTIYTEALSQN